MKGKNIILQTENNIFIYGSKQKSNTRREVYKLQLSYPYSVKAIFYSTKYPKPWTSKLTFTIKLTKYIAA